MFLFYAVNNGSHFTLTCYAYHICKFVNPHFKRGKLRMPSLQVVVKYEMEVVLKNVFPLVSSVANWGVKIVGPFSIFFLISIQKYFLTS